MFEPLLLVLNGSAAQTTGTYWRRFEVSSGKIPLLTKVITKGATRDKAMRISTPTTSATGRVAFDFAQADARIDALVRKVDAFDEKADLLLQRIRSNGGEIDNWLVNLQRLATQKAP